MPKKIRPYSHYAKDAAALLGQLIRKARVDRKMTTEDLADRAGLSRGLLRRIENGDLGCTLGAAFEAAAIAGVPLFDADERALASAVASNSAVMTLLPKSVAHLAERSMTISKKQPTEAFVCVALPEATTPVVAGRLFAAGEQLHFNYGRSYLARNDAIALYEPELPLRAESCR